MHHVSLKLPTPLQNIANEDGHSIQEEHVNTNDTVSCYNYINLYYKWHAWNSLMFVR